MLSVLCLLLSLLVWCLVSRVHVRVSGLPRSIPGCVRTEVSEHEGISVLVDWVFTIRVVQQQCMLSNDPMTMLAAARAGARDQLRGMGPHNVPNDAADEFVPREDPLHYSFPLPG